MAKSRATWIWLSVALIVAVLALAWPSIEEQLRSRGTPCPWPFTLLHPAHKSAGHAPASDAVLPTFTLEALKKYDGSDESLPILLAVGGKVLDVTSGAKFYGPGKTYAQFAGTACTRALALGSLDKTDITDDVSDFDESQQKEMLETLEFYYDKYPVVGALV